VADVITKFALGNFSVREKGFAFKRTLISFSLECLIGQVRVGNSIQVDVKATAF
jgi:hypothetical protein